MWVGGGGHAVALKSGTGGHGTGGGGSSSHDGRGSRVVAVAAMLCAGRWQLEASWWRLVVVDAPTSIFSAAPSLNSTLCDTHSQCVYLRGAGGRVGGVGGGR